MRRLRDPLDRGKLSVLAAQRKIAELQALIAQFDLNRDQVPLRDIFGRQRQLREIRATGGTVDPREWMDRPGPWADETSRKRPNPDTTDRPNLDAIIAAGLPRPRPEEVRPHLQRRRKTRPGAH